MICSFIYRLFKEPKTIKVRIRSGSPNIQVQAWVNANTNEYVDDITDNAECWCEDCGEHTKLKEV